MLDYNKRFGVKIKDPALAKAMSRIGYLDDRRDTGGALVLPKRPEPVQIGGAAAKLEAA